MEWLLDVWNGVVRNEFSPWLALVLFTAPLVAVALWRRAFPTLLMVGLWAIPAILSFVWMRDDRWVEYLLAIDAVLALLAFVDLITIPREDAFQVERNAGRTASLNRPHDVRLVVSNLSGRDLRLLVRDGVPQQFQADPEEFDILLETGARATLDYQLQPSTRGAFELDAIHLRVPSFCWLWNAFYKLPLASPINVYPDMKQLAEYAVLARTNRLSLMGVRRVRKVGQDNEFERLRDYTLDDNYKHLDWRTTARRQKLTVKDFQTNQSQRIIFLIDCGRMMTNEAEELSLLDHALNSMLMLSYVALRQGDSVGAICFDDSIQAFVPPRSGSSQMNRLLHAAYDRHPRLVESRYDEAFLYLSRQCRKRALVVLMTNVIDEVNARQVQQYLTNLVGRHLPLGLLMRDRRIFEAVESYEQGGGDLFHAAAAAGILSWRHEVIRDLIHQGVLAIDAFPDAMTAPLVNQYLEVKARHLL